MSGRGRKSQVSQEEAGGEAEGVHTWGLSVLRGLGGGQPAGDRKGEEGRGRPAEHPGAGGGGPGKMNCHQQEAPPR